MQSLIQDLPPLRCFVLGNFPATLDSVKQPVLVGRSLSEYTNACCLFLHLKLLKKEGNVSGAHVFHTYQKKKKNEEQAQCL